jgi:hypothetical protein
VYDGHPVSGELPMHTAGADPLNKMSTFFR